MLLFAGWISNSHWRFIKLKTSNAMALCQSRASLAVTKGAAANGLSLTPSH